MPLNSIEAIQPSYQITPIMQALLANNDTLPNTGLPAETEGTIQENVPSAVPEVTLYNAHGILNKTKPNALLGVA
jgi:hypothetical protein